MELMMTKWYVTIDQCVKCKIPSDVEELKDVVLLLQQQSPSSYCRKRGSC